ncbi:hypothetical protein LEP1GSC123_3413 [Leptospira borgpetersenii str. 200701203]|uniref:Uncharacterized protein n=1 Tax=Leptospira borgpetersenii str. 200701203 TaxID=1193007 RepID=M3GDY6_LEPBO|nr:hypothetical protein LEP1GSC123_3413 [Leptospira borgpetersenii str. 200701203]
MEPIHINPEPGKYTFLIFFRSYLFLQLEFSFWYLGLISIPL